VADFREISEGLLNLELPFDASGTYFERGGEKIITTMIKVYSNTREDFAKPSSPVENHEDHIGVDEIDKFQTQPTSQPNRFQEQETTQNNRDAHCPIKNKHHDEQESAEKSESRAEKSKSWSSTQV